MRESSDAVVTDAVVALTGDLHARPAASLAIAAAKYESSIALLVGDRRADARSVLAVMAIGATTGQQVRIHAEGPDATQAVRALSELLAQATQVGT